MNSIFGEKIKVYRLVAFVFHLSLINQCPSTAGRKVNICESLRKVLNYLFASHFIIRVLFFLKYHNPVEGYKFNYILDIITIFVFRHHLLKQAPALKNIEERLRKLEHKLFDRFIILWFILHLLYHIFIFTLHTYLKVQNSELIHCREEAFGYVECSELSKKLLIAFGYFKSIFMYWMTQGTFGIFYVLTCHRICFVLRRFKRSLLIHHGPDYRLLLADYLKVKKMVLEMDNNLCFLLFLFLLSNTISLFSLYNALQLILNGHSDLFILGQLVRFSNSLFSLFVLYNAARSVSDLSLDISEEAKQLPQNPQQSHLDHILFLMNTDKGITMTMFGGISINIGFCLAYFGTAIPYLVLYKSIAR